MRASPAACNECRDLLGGYVLGALEPDEAERVRTHLLDCARCAAEYEELAGVPALLDMAGDESSVEKPPAALEEAVLDRFAREHPVHEHDQGPRMPFWGWRDAARRRLARPLPAALAGALAAAAVTAVVLLVPAGTGDRNSGEGYQATLWGDQAAHGASAKATLTTFSAGTRMRLHVRGLRSSPDAVYELWCVRDDGVKVSAGTFRVDAGGRADVSLTSAAVPGEYHRLSVERRAQNEGAGGGQLVMTGDIQYPRS